MPLTNPTQFNQCDSSFRNEEAEFGADADALWLDNIRTILSVVSDLLAPAYILLSFVAVGSRYNSVLKLLASHGKTSTTETKSTKTTTTTTRTDIVSSASSMPWCWVSKRCFSHFYVVGLLSTGVATAIGLWKDVSVSVSSSSSSLATDQNNANYGRIAAVVLLLLHLFRRAYECVCVQQHTKVSSKMHIAGYALGVGYYLVLPLVFWDIRPAATVPRPSTCTVSATKESNNDFRNSFHSTTNTRNHSKISVDGFVVLAMMIGVNLWLQYEQHAHHDILADMRRTKSTRENDGSENDENTTHQDDNNDNDNDNDNPTRQTKNVSEVADTGGGRKLPCTPRHYSLPPYRRWFRYVLSPHYLAEILLYVSFAVLLEEAAATAAAEIEDTTRASMVPEESTCANDSIGSNGANTNSSIGTSTSTYGLWNRRALVLLSNGRSNRHWALLLWVATNLTVSALNTYDWYHSRWFHNDKTAASEGRVDPRKALVPLIL
eukprot:jgi/Psemu1/46306/gm1.46306_g